jgi:hypothetical protein
VQETSDLGLEVGLQKWYIFEGGEPIKAFEEISPEQI